MLGGVICGYWAIGRLKTATPPVRVMMMDTTVAKIGRSMKKRENNFRPLRGPTSPKRQRGFSTESLARASGR